MEGRGVKTYFEKLLRSFPAKRSRVASPGLPQGLPHGCKAGMGVVGVQHPWGPVQLPGWVTQAAFPGGPVQTPRFGFRWF